jgi:hypothetical protein
MMPFLGTTGGGSVKQYGGQANLGYFIKNSLRFRAANTSNLSRSHSASDRQKWTFSFWVKRGNLDTDRIIGVSGTGSQGYVGFVQDNIYAIDYDGSTTYWNLYTNAVFRDPAAWYHIVLALDTTQATSSNRVKLYVNGSLITSFQAEAYPTQNYQGYYNSAVTTYIGRRGYDTNDTLDGYLAEFNFVDGQQLTPSSFGKTDAATGQWIPKKYLSTYGTNGFYLKFADASAATAAAIGKDSSPNGNNFTPNNISVTTGATYDAMIDSPTLSAVASNYCTLNPLKKGTTYIPTISNGNLTYTAEYNAQNPASSTIGVSTGSWYYEATITNKGYVPGVGVHDPSNNFGTGDNWRSYINGIILFSEGTLHPGGTSTGYTFAAGDVMGIAFDASSGKVWIAKNNTWFNSGNPAAGTGQVGTATGYSALAPVLDGTNVGGNKDTINVNFGQRPFSYTPPSGFKSLNTFNLP